MKENKKISKLIHDMANSLQGIMGYAQLSILTDDPVKLKEFAKKMFHESEKVNAHIIHYQNNKHEFSTEE